MEYPTIGDVRIIMSNSNSDPYECFLLSNVVCDSFRSFSDWKKNENTNYLLYIINPGPYQSIRIKSLSDFLLLVKKMPGFLKALVICTRLWKKPR